MTLTLDELKGIYLGAYRFEETEDGFLAAHQYTKRQVEYFKGVSEFWYERCTASTAKTLEFTTRAKRVSFEYRLVWKGSSDSFELCVNGRIRRIDYVEKLPESSRLSFDLPDGEKQVIIYLPADAAVHIRGFECDAPVLPPRKGKKVLWLGDSITQGFGPLRSGQTYVSVANRILNYDIINQGIGGYVYDKNVLEKMDGYYPDTIIIAMGTNQYGTESMAGIDEYYEVLTRLYPDVPIICVTPLWRGDNPAGTATLEAFCRKLRAIAGSRPNVTVIDGFELVPHLEEYFLDRLHPNCLGCEVYGRNLADKILSLGF